MIRVYPVFWSSRSNLRSNSLRLSIVCRVVDHHQHHTLLEIRLKSRCVVAGPPGATSRRADTGMKTCEVPDEASLGPLFPVYIRHKLGLKWFACVLKSLSQQ